MDLSGFSIDGEPSDNRRGLTSEPPYLHRAVLAFDQSLSNTGWALFRTTGQAGMFSRTGMVQTKAGERKGHEANLSRALEVYDQIRAILRAFDDIDLVVHETPPAGGRMSRPESSLLAALAVRLAAEERDLPLRMIGAQHVKKVLTGNGNADKKELRPVLDRLYPILADLKPRNDDTYDAAGLAVVGAMEE